MSRYIAVYCDSADGCKQEDGRDKILRNSIEIELPDGGFDAETHWLGLRDLEIWLTERLAADGWTEDRHGDAICPDCLSSRMIDEALRELP